MNTWLQALILSFLLGPRGLANQKSKDQEREFYSLKEKKALVREWQEDLRERDGLLGVDFNQALQALGFYWEKPFSRSHAI